MTLVAARVQFLRAYLSTAPAIIRAYYREESGTGGHCIASTAIGMRVCKHVGIPATECSVDVVMTAPDGYTIGCRHDQPFDPEDPKAPRGWYGHLVLLVDPCFLIDVATRQFSRPQHGMVFGEEDQIVVALQPNVLQGFLAGEGWAGGKAGQANVSYRAAPGNAGYRASPDWQNKDGRLDEPVERIIAALRLPKGGK